MSGDGEHGGGHGDDLVVVQLEPHQLRTVVEPVWVKMLDTVVGQGQAVQIVKTFRKYSIFIWVLIFSIMKFGPANDVC